MMKDISDIRTGFLDYFARHDHEVLPSGGLVPHNDPSLMFANSGMAQFKNVFTGVEKRPCPRAATAQKCVRAGGKHNDLDNVGYTARHHTFFEMLGNFSFGDYFKAEAIELAWNLLTKEFGLSEDRLLTTVYSEDEEAFGLWRKVAGLDESRIIRISTSDNFWTMGDKGPCGPCSEIFYDHGESVAGGPPGSPDEDGDRFVEIWNLVFMQYEQLGDGERIELPKRSIDTGMGLERIATVLQGIHDNYETDLFRALISASVEASGTPAEGGHRASHRVIADHLRASAFLIADGVLPSNEGRGYVLRRIMRRAMRHGSLLGAKEPLLHRLVPALLEQMGEAYPELVRARRLITDSLLLEETRFRRTLERGMGLLEEAVRDLPAGSELDGETAFKLYDTYGFPLDLTQDALRRRSIGVDGKGFSEALARSKALARASWSGAGGSEEEKIWFDLRERMGSSEFLGYSSELAEGIAQAIVVDGREAESVEAGGRFALVANQTPFYAESGGQLGDCGVIRFEGGSARIEDTLKRGEGLFVHFGEVVEGALRRDSPLELEVDHEARAGLRAHHSATHLIHESLRRVLGDHVVQKGSLVAPDRLRFDFSHPVPLTPEELSSISSMANASLRRAWPVETRIMSKDDAISAGAMALFGEKYGEEVRVVSMGRESEGSPFSLELCGGTHVGNTGEIGLIHVLGESAVSSGVRRIEALASASALSYLLEQEHRLKRIALTLRIPSSQAVERTEALASERKQLERSLSQARRELALAGGGSDDSPWREVNGIRFLAQSATDVAPKELKNLVDEWKRKLDSGVAMMASVSSDGKAAVVVGVTDDLTEKYSAIDLVRAASEALGGKGGGGRPDMAQAGGPDGAKISEAIAAVEAIMSRGAAP